MRSASKRSLRLKRANVQVFPEADQSKDYMLYIHIPFCERLCPYCSFNRLSFDASRARKYFEALRKEMRLVASAGYNCKSVYVGGGTPTIDIDELLLTLKEARELFDIHEISAETNPNHLTPEHIERLHGNVNRLSVGVQSFNDKLLAQMDRLDKYGNAAYILSRLKYAKDAFDNLNVDMIFNFPSQTEDMLINDIAAILESGVAQTTFYPLMASPVVAQKLKETVGIVDYRREKTYYELLSAALTENGFEHGSAWTFNSRANDMIDEYIVDFEEYPAIGSGGISYVGGKLFVNTFSITEYVQETARGHAPIMGWHTFKLKEKMRYRLMMKLFGLRLDKLEWKRDFGVSVERGLPADYLFLKNSGAFDIDDSEQITLSPKGRYLLVAMMREFFVGVNTLRDIARAALPEDERELQFH
jgi:coproporphyrinogen III oxidase-like Fe-S oxidoreductase